jgi:signal transduction histidine kinase
VAVFALSPPVAAPVDLPALNDVAQTLAADFDRVGTAGYELPRPGGVPDYAVFAASGERLGASGPGAAEDLGAALRRGDTVLDLMAGDVVLGRVAFADAREAALAAYAARLRVVSLGALGVLALGCAAVLWRVWGRILRPFGEMQAFAARVAGGDLDAPLAMDRANAFGAFTESFDLMRAELAAAREREREAEISKKELVAGLSHDILTPVASIKAVAEVAAAKAPDAAAREQLGIVAAKADQITALVGGLFAATLEELEQLAVSVVEFASTEWAAAISSSDPARVRPFEMPECLVWADPVRAAQVVDNVVANSAKYAGTPISVGAAISGGRLVVTLADSGPGAAESELPLLATKYFRGAVASGKPGAGLGLYISKTLMEAMGGEFSYRNLDPGFEVSLGFALV